MQLHAQAEQGWASAGDVRATPIKLLLDKRDQHHEALLCQAAAHLMACQNVAAACVELLLNKQDQHHKTSGDNAEARLMAAQYARSTATGQA